MAISQTTSEIIGVMDVLKLDMIARLVARYFDRDDDEIDLCGSMTANRAANPNKDADTNFGLKRPTLNRTLPPALRTVTDWVTLAVEVGRSQPWVSLEAATQLQWGLYSALGNQS
ncbi:unnamed protein product [Phytophthora fragariaefolia]|uniref:Unnamed protein product n=1 Tax=Phytophthora fragariaefolia TaxID=1490495 RepID=A0A9W6YP79_9STRA|nr:unnamed protein product [Phytophthora fragariaefolia]